VEAQKWSSSKLNLDSDFLQLIVAPDISSPLNPIPAILRGGPLEGDLAQASTRKSRSLLSGAAHDGSCVLPLGALREEGIAYPESGRSGIGFRSGPSRQGFRRPLADASASPRWDDLAIVLPMRSMRACSVVSVYSGWV
jgi:hypothetical protein